jgi:2-keto-4-pentenoate hydratase/2-oxohepta-3-ene-1,7-dioic acid hydratase in catechol pathway
VDYEAELAFVIKKTAKNVKEEDAGDYILGYTCFNDVTARDLQATDGQWSRAKGFDTFAPLGPRICTDVKPDNLKIECVVNGKVRQSSNTKNFIFPVPRLLSFVSSVMTLLPGDVVATGTPAGIGQINPGDVVEVRIDKIGILKNKVRSE